MKRAIALLLAALMMTSVCLFAAGCKTGSDDVTTTAPDTETTTKKEPENTTTSKEPETTTSETTETTIEQTSQTTSYDKDKIINDGEFDESNIVFSFGAMSDIHLTGNSDSYEAKFKSALEQLKKAAGGKLDAVVGAGDITDSGTNTQVRQLKNVYESVLDPVSTPFIYSMGNHDAKNNTSTTLKSFYTLFGGNYFKYDLGTEAEILTWNRHFVVGIFHFLTLMPDNYYDGSDVKFSASTVKWLDDTLASITNESPNAYVFILCHAMIYDTCYGSTLYTSPTAAWYTMALTDTLSKYQQAVVLSGHLHFPLNDERSIMQTDFTTVGCGGVRYMAIENAGYEKMQSATVMLDKEEFSQGLLIQIDKNGNTRFVRMDFYHSSVIKNAWVIPAPDAEKKNLTVYGKDRAEKTTAPTMTGNSELYYVSATSTTVYVGVRFDKAQDDDLIHDYVISIYYGDNLETERKTFKILADFYKNAQPWQMKTVWEQNLGGFKDGTVYTVKLVARDSWENESEPVFLKFTVDAANKTFTVVD